MLRVTASTSASGAKDYFGKGLTRADYYIDGQEITGRWGGKAAEQLGLAGDVDAERYFAMCDNLHPETGERLTPRQKSERRVAYDFTFSVPKPVSVLYELSGDQRILDAFRDAVRETMQDIESEMKTRVRSGGRNEDRTTGNLVYAEFVHFTSRPVDGVPDPHLHAHCFAFNVTRDEAEQRWKAGQFGDLKRDADYFEAAFHARMAKRLNDLGYATERKGTSFGLVGMPASLTDKFSRRRNLIEAQAAAKGIMDADAKHTIGYYGREHKTLDLARTELREGWSARLSPQEWKALQDVMKGQASTGGGMAAQEAMDYALAHAFERASTLPEKRLKAEALRHGVGSVLPAAIDEAARRPDVMVVEKNGERLTTTRQVLEQEMAMLDLARNGRGHYAPLPSQEDTLAGLDAEQRQAALHVLHSRDFVTGIRGGAGTGKTYTLQSLKAAVEEGSGGQVRMVGFAPSANASRGELAKAGFKDAETLERLLVDDKLQAQIRGQVLLVDEAGMISTRDMVRLMNVAKAQQARLVLTGDYRQHASVAAGDAFRLLEAEAGVRYAELKTIRRQRDPAYKRAVETISTGTAKDAQKGFEQLDKMGAIVEASGDTRHDLLISDYLTAVGEGRTGLIIAPTHAEGDRLTDALRDRLKTSGQLGQERRFVVRHATGWTEAQKGDGRNYEAGMLVQFHQSAKGFKRGDCAVVVQSGAEVMLQKRDGSQTPLRLDTPARFQVYTTGELNIAQGDRIRITQNGYLKPQSARQKPVRFHNGEIYTVEGFTEAGDLKLSGGKVLPKTYGHMSLGYVDTSYASQGKTVDRVFIATGSESLRAANQQQWYVSVSRGRESAKVYVDSKDDVKDAIARSGARLSAVELVRPEAERKPRFNLREFIFERNRIGRYLKARAQEAMERLRSEPAPKQGWHYAR